MATQESGDIRFGIMCNGATFRTWQASAIEQLCALEGVRCELLIVDDTPRLGLGARIRKQGKFRNLLWLTYLALNQRRSKAMRSVDLSTLLKGVPEIRCKVRQKGKFSQYFEKQDLEAIRENKLDFILRFGFGIIRGEVLSTARYGVWSFHHDDEQKYRGGPPCFWEIYHDDKVTGAILQRLTDRLDGGVVLEKGYLKTRYSYIQNRDQLYEESARWPAKLCVDIRHGLTQQFENPPSKTTAPIYLAPTNLQFATYLFRTTVLKCRDLATKLLYVDYWNIGIANAPPSTFVESEKPSINWLPTQSARGFAADPFAVKDPKDGGRLHVLYEDFPYDDSKGKINHVLFENGTWGATTEVISLPFHLSYPYPIEHEGAIYLVPESFEDNCVCLYKATDFPLRWERSHVLLKDFAGIDSTLVEHDGKWWMFTSDRHDGAHFNLHLFWAEDLFGRWFAHPRNPIKTDIRSARCAGTPFLYDGSLIRPSMDYSEKVEGRIVLNRIDTLSTTDFAEESIRTIDPYCDSPWPDKIHTLANAGEHTVVDGCREAFVLASPHFFRFKLKSIGIPVPRFGKSGR